MATPVLPDRTSTAVIRQFGESGRQWVENQPGVLSQLAESWRLEIGRPFEEGWPTNVVYAATRGSQQLVLKTGYPGPELFTEMQVLQLWRGREGCVQLADYDETHGVMLLERIVPGTMFKQASLETRSHQMPNLFQTVPLKIQEPLSLPGYDDWVSRAFSTYRESDRTELLNYIDLAEKYLSEVLSTYPQAWLLHGDLHHLNMLLNSNGDWIAIDPKGVTGPRVLEYGRFMHNFIADELNDDNSIEKILLTRAATLAGEFAPNELLKVGFIDLVLAIAWTLNDGEALTAQNEELLRGYSALTL